MSETPSPSGPPPPPPKKLHQRSVKCSRCGRRIAYATEVSQRGHSVGCRHCGAQTRIYTWGRIFLIVLGILLMLAAIGLLLSLSLRPR